MTTILCLFVNNRNKTKKCCRVILLNIYLVIMKYLFLMLLFPLQIVLKYLLFINSYRYSKTNDIIETDTSSHTQAGNDILFATKYVHF